MHACKKYLNSRRLLMMILAAKVKSRLVLLQLQCATQRKFTRIPSADFPEKSPTSTAGDNYRGWAEMSYFFVFL